MSLDYNKLMDWQFERVPQQYQERDSILYALGIGLGRNPINRDQLNYVYEQNLQTLPTMAVTLASPGMWVADPSTGINVEELVHSGQSAVFHKSLPAAAAVVGQAKISHLYDRGPERGALMIVQRSIADAVTRDCYCTLEQTLLLRANGGFGGQPPPASGNAKTPERSADFRGTWETTPGQAILYRLSGDLNPLHIDPDTAERAGFSQPILHGYCSYGIAGWMLCQLAERSASDLASLECRFSAPVIPGDSIEFEAWRADADTLQFRARVGARVVLKNGLARFR